MIRFLKATQLWPKFLVAGLLTLLLACNASEQVSATEVVMYKSPGCECCADWAKHLQTEGFTVIEHKRDDMDSIKAEHGVTSQLASCHTAIIGNYVIEGHVPAADIKRLLQEKPADVIGLSAPGMPMKSPGMQAEGLAPKNYDVLSFDKQGNSKIYKSYR